MGKDCTTLEQNCGQNYPVVYNIYMELVTQCKGASGFNL